MFRAGAHRTSTSASALLAVLLAAPIARGQDAPRASDAPRAPEAPQPAPPPTSDPAPAPSSGEAVDVKERAKLAYEKYNAGKIVEAIVDWNEVYKEVGREKGYRVAFNLARAYDELGDATNAGEFYARYVREVEKRRDAGTPIEANVADQEAEARKRLRALAPQTARIRVQLNGSSAVRIDGSEPYFESAPHVVYVRPGEHVVTFGTGDDAKKRAVKVEKGDEVYVEPPPPPPPPPPPKYETVTEHPYSKAILYAAGGAAVVSIIIPVILYSNTSAIADDYDAANTPTHVRDEPGTALNLKTEYESARANAYASLAIPISLAAITIGLTAFYYLGARETKVRVGATSFAGLRCSGAAPLRF